MLQLPPLSLYIHFPWCARKCPYCDFNSHTAERIPERAYIDALKRDLDHETEQAAGRPLQSVFIGGGTPSLISAEGIGAILDHAQHTIGFNEDVEITLEANPGSAEQQKFSAYRRRGVNRLSIGIQSFQAGHLQALGRIHSAPEASSAVQAARAAGFNNINIDLMHGLPGQTIGQALDDLQRAIDLEVQHLSWYQLTIEPNTAFYSRPPPLPEEDTLGDIQAQGEQLLAGAGFQQYEVSAYARSQQVARHNLNYWLFGDYLGIGAGAHSKITDRTDGTIARYSKTRLPDHYLQGTPGSRVGERVLHRDELPLEFMMNALRLTGGFRLQTYRQHTGLDPAELLNRLESLVARGLLMVEGDRVRTTRLGQQFLDSILVEF